MDSRYFLVEHSLLFSFACRSRRRLFRKIRDDIFLRIGDWHIYLRGDTAFSALVHSGSNHKVELLNINCSRFTAWFHRYLHRSTVSFRMKLRLEIALYRCTGRLSYLNGDWRIGCRARLVGEFLSEGGGGCLERPLEYV